MQWKRTRQAFQLIWCDEMEENRTSIWVDICSNLANRVKITILYLVSFRMYPAWYWSFQKNEQWLVLTISEKWWLTRKSSWMQVNGHCYAVKLTNNNLVQETNLNFSVNTGMQLNDLQPFENIHLIMWNIMLSIYIHSASRFQKWQFSTYVQETNLNSQQMTVCETSRRCSILTPANRKYKSCSAL